MVISAIDVTTSRCSPKCRASRGAMVPMPAKQTTGSVVMTPAAAGVTCKPDSTSSSTGPTVMAAVRMDSPVRTIAASSVHRASREPRSIRTSCCSATDRRLPRRRARRSRASSSAVKSVVVQRAQAVLQLLHATGPHDHRGDALVAQAPCQCHLGQRLASALGDLVQGADVLEVLFGQLVTGQRGVRPGHPGIGGDALEVLVGEQALRQRREGDAADACPAPTCRGAIPRSSDSAGNTTADE